ncbi:MAG: purine-nucleoside phosphorylase [Myxococcota bacterium]|nr:purine-nucleoside phosphorylase [Myxococcota bacterium]
MSTYYDQVQEAVRAIGASESPTVGVVLGSGLSAFVEQIDEPRVIPYRDIPNFPVSNVEGHKGELVLGKIGSARIVVMSGRVHYYEGHAMSAVTFPIRVLAGLGIKTLLVTNAAGGINTSFRPGDFMIITDHLNLVTDNPLRGVNDDRFGIRFPDMTEAYSKAASDKLREAAKFANVTPREGVYAFWTGPCYETPAEIRMLRTLGADAVGMSTVPEVIVARHAGLTVCGVSIITNAAAGISGATLSHDEVKEVAGRVQKPMRMMLARAVQTLA